MSLDQAIFLGIALVGALFLFISFVLGEIGDFFDDVGDYIGDHVPDFGGADADVGGDVDVGGHDVGHGGSEAGDSPSPFSLRSLMAFMTAYGAAGLIATAYGASTLVASTVSLVPGAVMTGVAYQGMKMLYSQQASSVVQVSGLVGKGGVVDVAIPPTGVGKVSVSTTEGYSSFIARSDGDQAIAAGERIVVTGSLGSELVVSRAPIPSGS